MITVQNHRIRVTVTKEIWDSYYEHAKFSACGHDIEKTQRGLVLSDAMRKLGSASELRIIEEEGPDMSSNERIAKYALMCEYMIRNGRRDARKLVERYRNGESISKRLDEMLMTAEEAAETLLSEKYDEAMRVLNDIAKNVEFLHDAEKQYRRYYADSEGWNIEIIGEMPELIGMCRYKKNDETR